MTVLDTTVLVYAVGGAHPLQEHCRRLVDALGDGFPATTTVEVIQEFAHVRSRGRPREEAVALARLYATMLSPLLPTSPLDLADGLTLFEHHVGLGAFDAVLAGMVARQPDGVLVSADRGFSTVPGLRHIVPGTPEFDALLG